MSELVHRRTSPLTQYTPYGLCGTVGGPGERITILDASITCPACLQEMRAINVTDALGNPNPYPVALPRYSLPGDRDA